MLHMTDMGKSPSLSKNYVFNLWCFVTFCTVLLQNQFFGFTMICRNIFCHDLRAIAWRKFEPHGEK